MSLFPKKEFTIADGEVILTIDDGLLPAKISPMNDINIVAISTNTTPTAGTFECFVELVEDGGFFGALKIGGTTNSIDATKVGTGVVDGDAEGWSFSGSPYRIKVKATGVTGATSVFVVVAQNGG